MLTRASPDNAKARVAGRFPSFVRLLIRHNNLKSIEHNNLLSVDRSLKMASPSEKLAASLQALKGLQDRGIVAVRSSDLSRTHRERLIENGFLQEVMRADIPMLFPAAPTGAVDSDGYMKRVEEVYVTDA